MKMEGCPLVTLGVVMCTANIFFQRKTLERAKVHIWGKGIAYAAGKERMSVETDTR